MSEARPKVRVAVPAWWFAVALALAGVVALSVEPARPGALLTMLGCVAGFFANLGKA